MKINTEQLIDLMQFAFTRLDGAWFMGAARKHGIEEAWALDVEAWKQFSYLLGKRIRKQVITDPVWPESFLEAMEILSTVLKIEGREVIEDGDQIIVRVTDCETQRMIARAGIADCGIVTAQTYEGMVRGLFDNNINVRIDHVKNLNHGDDCCEVIITRVL